MTPKKRRCPASSLSLLSPDRLKTMVVLLGTGGVGKTSCALVLAYALAQRGKRVLLLTVDPARRLHGLMERVALDQPGLTLEKSGTGELFERFIRNHSPDQRTVEAILSSRFFPYLSDHLPALHEYVASDLIREATASGSYDHIVVDTPPFAYAVHFLDAPRRLKRMAELTNRVLLVSGDGRRSRLSPILTKGLSFFLGRSFLNELVEFVASFGLLWSTVAQTARETDLLFRSSSSYGVVITPDLRATTDLVRLLREVPDWLDLEFLLVNRDFRIPECTDPDCAAPSRLAEAIQAEPSCRLWKPQVVDHAARSASELWKAASAVQESQERSLRVLEENYAELVREHAAYLPYLPGGIQSDRDLKILARTLFG